LIVYGSPICTKEFANLIGFVCFYAKFYDEIAFPMKRLRPRATKQENYPIIIIQASSSSACEDNIRVVDEF
jgi:hypothetical protein